MNGRYEGLLNLPVLGCTLGPDELAERAHDWEAAGRQALLGREAEPGRAIFRYRRGRGKEEELRRLVGLEGHCCAFLTFTFATQGSDLVLTISGPNAEAFMAPRRP